MQTVINDDEFIELLGYNSSKKIFITDKNTSEVVREIPLATDEILSEKINLLKNSPSLDLESRILRLNEAFEYLKKNINSLTELEAQETGIPVSDFSFRWTYLLNSDIEEYANMSLGHNYEYLFDNNWRSLNKNEIYEQAIPLGIVLNVTPNNDNVGVAIKTLIDCIIAGVKVLYKPGSKAPSALINVISVLKEFIPGYIDVFVGEPSTIYNIIKNPAIQGVIFTGKSEHGKQVHQECIKEGIVFVGEYEGTNINFICEDSKLSKGLIVRIAMATRAWNGIACANPHLTTVEGELYSDIVEGLIKIAEYVNSRIGPSTDQNTLVGPVLSEKLAKKYTLMLDAVKSAQQNILAGGELIDNIAPYTLIEGSPQDIANFSMNPGVKKDLSIAVASAPILWINNDFQKTMQWYMRQTPHKVGYHLRCWINSCDRNRIKEIASKIPSSMMTDDVFYFPNGKWCGLGRTSSMGNGDFLVRRLIRFKSLSFSPIGYDPFGKNL